jgi:hypothetical protein
MKTACGLLFAICLLGFAQAPTSGGKLMVQTPTYTLYADSRSELAESRHDLDFAVSKFEYYFGQQPPPITALIFDSAQELQSYNYSPLIKSHQRYLAWLSPESLASTTVDVAAIPGLGIVIANVAAGTGVKVAALVPRFKPPESLKQGDVILGLNARKCSSVQEFRSVYAQFEPGAKIELAVVRGEEQLKLTFDKPPSNASLSQFGRASSSFVARVLSHEAAHIFFEAWLDRKLGRQALEDKPPSDEIEYGHPAVPAWLNEAVATLAEPKELQERRYTFLIRHLKGAMPLTELFTMKHPVSVNRQEDLKQAVETAQKQGGGSISVIDVPNGAVFVMDVPNGAVLDKETFFYAESLTVAQFLAEREGPTFIHKIAEGLAHGLTMQEVLHSAKHVPANIDQLNAAWREWLFHRSDRAL